MTIREAELGDLQELHRFNGELFEERLPFIYRRDLPFTLDETREFLDRISRPAQGFLLVAVTSGTVVGMLDFHRHRKPQLSHGGTFGVSVARSRRRKGIGTRLVAELLAVAPLHGIRRVELEVFSNNPSAISLYEKMGFLHEGRRIGSVEMDGGFLDVLLMVKVLQPSS